MAKVMWKKYWLNSLVLLALLLLTTKCKKDRLKDDKAILIGEWEWIGSDKNNFGTLPAYEYLTTATEGAKYQIEFLKKGKVLFKKDGNVEERKRIVFERWNQPASNYTYFDILLNNSLDDQLIGSLDWAGGDTLTIFDRWPYKESEDCSSGCDYVHYYRKH